MKKIIPFRKDLEFKTPLAEVTSISLEHRITSKSKEIISGEFIISGDYKIAESSINREKFDFTLPFDIAIGTKINLDNMVIDIDDFYYEVIKNGLKVNIDLLIEGEEIASDIKEEVRDSKKEAEPEISNDISFKEPDFEEVLEKRDDDMMDIDINDVNMNNNDNINVNNNVNMNNNDSSVVNNDINNNNNFNLFSNVSNNETYSAYRVYVIKEEDTIDSILSKYGVSKEDLESYNNLEDIKYGDKIIIPYVRNE